MADTDKALRAALYRLVFSIERHGPEAKRAHAGALKQAWDALGHSDEEFALIDGAATLTEKDLRDCFERENGYPLPAQDDGSDGGSDDG